MSRRHSSAPAGAQINFGNANLGRRAGPPSLALPQATVRSEVAGKPFRWVNILKQQREEQYGRPKVKTDREKEARELKERRAKLTEYFLTYDAPDSCRKLYVQWKDLKRQKEELDRNIPTTMVMQMEEPRETFVLIRGDYRNRGEKVSPGVPTSLPPLPKDAPPNRLGLAKWLVDPLHPLTCRAAFW